MDLRDAFIKAVSEIIMLYGFKPQFIEEKVDDFTTSADQVNFLISFTGQLKGKVLYSMDKEKLYYFASIILNREIQELDPGTINDITDLFNFITKGALGKFQSTSNFSHLPSMLITGDNILLINNNLKIKKLLFNINDLILTVSYSLEC